MPTGHYLGFYHRYITCPSFSNLPLAAINMKDILIYASLLSFLVIYKILQPVTLLQTRLGYTHNIADKILVGKGFSPSRYFGGENCWK